jgi:hypothetical protein
MGAGRTANQPDGFAGHSRIHSKDARLSRLEDRGCIAEKRGGGFLRRVGRLLLFARIVQVDFVPLDVLTEAHTQRR